MQQIFNRILCSAVLLMIIPVIAWLVGWVWLPGNETKLTEMMFWLTETASSPWAIITCVVLALWFCWLLKLNIKRSCYLILILAMAIIGGQVIKSSVKSIVQAPRPFVMWLEQAHSIDNMYFYSLPRKERSSLIKQKLNAEQVLPDWLISHWRNETGYSFPSGHTLFTASWALLAVVLLWPRRYYITVVVVMVWAILVASSRLILGMHWPTDLIASVIISAVIVGCVGVCLKRWDILGDKNIR